MRFVLGFVLEQFLCLQVAEIAKPQVVGGKPKFGSVAATALSIWKWEEGWEASTACPWGMVVFPSSSWGDKSWE